MKLTEWYPGDVKPVRVGVYQRRYPNNAIMYCYWNGLFFFAGEYTVNKAIVYKFDTLRQNLPWRGVAK